MALGRECAVSWSQLIGHDECVRIQNSCNTWNLAHSREKDVQRRRRSNYEPSCEPQNSNEIDGQSYQVFWLPPPKEL